METLREMDIRMWPQIPLENAWVVGVLYRMHRPEDTHADLLGQWEADEVLVEHSPASGYIRRYDDCSTTYTTKGLKCHPQTAKTV